MKSRISVEVNFNNGNEPVIQILRKDSDDVRDSLIAAFIQKLGGDSCFLRIECAHDHRPNHVWDDESFQRWLITPIPLSDFEKAIEGMQELQKYYSHTKTLKSLSSESAGEGYNSPK